MKEFEEEGDKVSESQEASGVVRCDVHFSRSLEAFKDVPGYSIRARLVATAMSENMQKPSP